MSRDTEEAHNDFAQWFEHNYGRNSIVDHEKRYQFLVKAIQCLAAVNAHLIMDIQQLEDRGTPLYLPSGLRYTGDLKQLG